MKTVHLVMWALDATHDRKGVQCVFSTRRRAENWIAKHRKEHPGNKTLYWVDGWAVDHRFNLTHGR